MTRTQGFTVFLTGLSGSGKSTISDALIRELNARARDVTVLDGDVVREMLSSELSFSRADRDLNIRRIGWVAGEITRHGGAVVVAAIAPYDAAREQARELVAKHGAFVLVHVATPLEACEARDPKGLYRRARAGEIAQFTGVSDEYEPPSRPDLVLDGSIGTPEQSAGQILGYLDERGLLDGARTSTGQLG